MEQLGFFTCLRKLGLRKLGYNRDFQQQAITEEKQDAENWILC